MKRWFCPRCFQRWARRHYPLPIPRGLISRGAAGPDPGFDAPISEDPPIYRPEAYVENVQSARRGELVPYCRCSDVIGYCHPADRKECINADGRRGRRFYGLVPR